MDDIEFPSSLEACIEKFWEENPELKQRLLKDWYNGYYISPNSNLAGLKAVGKWLDSAAFSE